MNSLTQNLPKILNFVGEFFKNASFVQESTAFEKTVKNGQT